MQPKVILLWPTHASVWRHDYQHHANSCHNVLCFCLMLLLVQSHEGSANLCETCKCGVASAAADAAATAAIIIVTDYDSTVDVAASTAGLSLFASQYMHQSLVTT